ncbi:hypothetical protein HA466_0013730 [Hirschfeldia incana]|nr:hypothetical protein HA466_0013730 [Hirschfeldia incana]
MATMTKITNRVSLKFLAPVDLKSSILRKPASVCFSNVGSSIVPRLVAASSSFNKPLFARGVTRSDGRNMGRVRASSRDEEEDEKRHYEVFRVLELFIDRWFRLCFFVVLIWFDTLRLLIDDDDNDDA